MKSGLQIFHRTVVRPLLRERLRTALTVVAVGLGVAVVVAIGLASEAATGSFRSSLETLAGTADLEITAVDGVREGLLGELVSLPYPVDFMPRVEGYGTLNDSGRTIMIAGVDLIGVAALEDAPSGETTYLPETIDAENPAWAGKRVAAARGENVSLTINSSRHTFTVQGLLQGEGLDELAQEDVLVLDLPLAQEVLGRTGRLDRILVFLPDAPPPAWVDGPADWQALLGAQLPDGVELKSTGARTDENRKMLAAFRWNLRVLSYIALVVGALLIYNTISVSVVRRRNEIGVIRALGATRGAIWAAFLSEAAILGLGGAVLGLVLGRVLAEGAVGLLAQTVRTLYVSSAPGEITLGWGAYATAAVAGIGVSLLAALIPAAEAARVAPSEAMARGRRERAAWSGAGRYLIAGLGVAAAATAASFAPPIGGRPLFGYAAAFALIGSLSLITPAVILLAVRWISPLSQRFGGAESFLATRGLKASLPRTSVLVAALGTAVAMLVSVAIMVGSYRETVVAWLDGQLRADLFLRAAGSDARDEIGLIDPQVTAAIRGVAGVEAVDQFRAYSFSYNGLPAVLGTGDAEVASRMGEMRFVHGEDPEEVIERMRTTETCIVSEPFSNKHGVRAGDNITLPLGDDRVDFDVAAVFYDYGNEAGTVIIDRSILTRYLDDPWPQNLAVYLEAGTDLATGRAAVDDVIAGSEVMMWSNRELRGEAMKIFDRTFAVTYALEVIAVAVAILGMAGALLALVIDRRRTYAVLRFLGASAGQIWRLTLIEAGLLGLLANVAGLLLGTALSFVLIFVINKQSFGWTIQFHPPQLLVGAALALVLLASVAAGVYPARLATRLNPMEAVHEE